MHTRDLLEVRALKVRAPENTCTARVSVHHAGPARSYWLRHLLLNNLSTGRTVTDGQTSQLRPLTLYPLTPPGIRYPVPSTWRITWMQSKVQVSKRAIFNQGSSCACPHVYNFLRAGHACKQRQTTDAHSSLHSLPPLPSPPSFPSFPSFPPSLPLT